MILRGFLGILLGLLWPAMVLADTLSADFLPLAAGNFWSYLRENGSTTTRSVSANTRVNDGSVVWPLQDSAENSEDYYSNDALGIRLHGSYTAYSDLGNGQATSALLTAQPPILEAPASVAAGQTTSGSGSMPLTLGISATTCPLSYSFSNSFWGFESISVPAGTFRAFRTTGALRIYGTITGPGGSAWLDNTQTVTRWLVPGVGVVKEQDNNSDGTSSTYALQGTNVVRTVPDAFDIPPAVGVVPGSQAVSSAVVVTSITAPAAISVSGGEYSINGGPFTGTAGTVSNGQSVVLRLGAPASASSSTSISLSVGGVAADFLVTTAGPLLPRVQLSATHLNFGTTTLGGGIQAGVSLALSNPGTATLNLASISASGDFSVASHTCGSALPVNHSCSLFLVFTPTATGVHNGTLSIVDDAGDSPQAVSLVGMALAAGKTSPLVTGGNNTFFAIREDQSLLAWGWNNGGQLGDGSSSDRAAPILIGTGFVAAASGGWHTLAVKVDGSLWSWGSNSFGESGSGQASGTPITIGNGFRSVAAGYGHSLALKGDGSLWAWGWNGNGQVGDGTYTDRSAPVQIGSGYIAVAAGFMHNLALKADGSLMAWGNNQFGQLGDGTGQDRLRPTRIGGGYVAVAAGQYHSLALKSDGSLWAWGYNTYGQLGDGSTNASLSPVQVGSGFAGIAAGQDHSMALKPDGSVLAWGWNNSGQIGDGSYVTATAPQLVGKGFVAVGAGNQSSIGLRNDGKVLSWGADGGVSASGHLLPTPVADGNGGLLSLFTPATPMLGLGTTAGGRITSVPAGVDCGLACTVAFDAGTLVSLTAVPDTGYLFSAWSGACSGANPACQITLNGSSSVGASFVRIVPTYIWSLSAGSLAFGEQVVGHSRSGALTLSNTGTGGFMLSSIQVTGDFSQSNDCWSVALPAGYLPGGASCTIQLVFTPTLPGARSGTLSIYANSTLQADLSGTGIIPAAELITANLVPGWNLLGNGSNGPVDVAGVFGDSARVVSVWKWLSGASPGWAFYAPTADGGAAYGVGKGYASLATVAAGEGFWVNARQAFSVSLGSGGLQATAHFQDGSGVAGANPLPPGWSLLAVGDSPTPRSFTNGIALTPPPAGTAATSLTTLWAWQMGVGATPAGWYFYAPAMDNSGVLGSYIDTKGYLDFGSRTLAPATGFWVNHP